MTDEKKALENRKGSSIFPPKIFEQDGVDILSSAAKVREFSPQEIDRSESTKRKLKVSTLLGLLIVISAVVLAFFFFGEPINHWLNKSAGSPAEVAPPDASSTPMLPMKPRVSAPVPTDAEIDAAPIPHPQATNDLLSSSTKV